MELVFLVLVSDISDISVFSVFSGDRDGDAGGTALGGIVPRFRSAGIPAAAAAADAARRGR